MISCKPRDEVAFERQGGYLYRATTERHFALSVRRMFVRELFQTAPPAVNGMYQFSKLWQLNSVSSQLRSFAIGAE